MWKNIRKTINSERNNIDYCELIEKMIASPPNQIYVHQAYAPIIGNHRKYVKSLFCMVESSIARAMFIGFAGFQSNTQ